MQKIEENGVSLNPRMRMRCAGNKIPFAEGEKAERPTASTGEGRREGGRERGQREIRNRPPELHGRSDTGLVLCNWLFMDERMYDLRLGKWKIKVAMTDCIVTE